jgi:DUF1680 family protein
MELTDPFWSNWQKIVREVSLPLQWQKLEDTGRLENFRLAATGSGEPKGLPFNDSDLYKWIEASAYASSQHESRFLREKVDEATQLIEAAQCADGYINTYFQLRFPEARWSNLNMMHEMYCAGHLIEAGVSVNQVFHDDRLLKVGVRFANHIMDLFGPDKRLGYPGHEEIELALIKLAAETGETKYREFARWLVDVRGSRPSPFERELGDPEAKRVLYWSGSPDVSGENYTGEYWQDHAPIREHTTVVGHAVRAMYLYIAATELAHDQDDAALESAILGCWDSLVKRRMYVTGGIGPSAHNEGFTADYDLPNMSSYAETCAACGLALWGQRLLEATGQSEYADIVELSLYNAMLAGISLDGKSYFYANPHESHGQHQRSEWFECACCPPNIARIISSLGQFAVSEFLGGLAIHIPVGMNVCTKDANVSINSNYPWSGRVEIRVTPLRPGNFRLMVRIPDWTDEVTSDVNGNDAAEFENGYMVFDREWSKDDVLALDFSMEPQFLVSHPKIFGNAGRTAVKRGPLIYALEETDNVAHPGQITLVGEEVTLGVPMKDLGGALPIEIEAFVTTNDFPDQLYAGPEELQFEPTTARFIPYYAWCNRGPAAMQVWVMD